MKVRHISFHLQTLPEQKLKRLAAILFIILILLIFIIALFPLLDGESKKHEAVTASMDTYVQQTVYGKNREFAAKVAANAVQYLDERASWDGENSEIFELNTQAGKEWITLSADIFAVLQTSQGVSEKSSGAFDITFAPVYRLWDFENERCTVPEQEEINEMLSCTGYKNLRLGMADYSASLEFNENAIDLTQVLHGAACDTAVGIYKENNVNAAIISVGGSVGLFGKKPDGTLWNIVVPDPEGTGTVGTLSLSSCFASTVSVYENAFEEKGKIYHSYLDPRTGVPADSGLESVTVVSESGTLSDALAAACIVSGFEKSLELLKAYSAEGVFIDTNGNICVTDGLRDAFTLTNKNFILKK